MATRTTVKRRLFHKLCAKYGWRCVYCGKELTKETATRDHVIPLSKGGAKGIKNIVPACRHCNVRKGDKILGVDIHANIARKPVASRERQ